jgi:O-antigen/teichoic acid export membrane protein
MGAWLRVKVELSGPFFWLMFGQVLLTGLSFITRMFGQILYAWQRLDLYNYSQSALLIVGFAGLWLGFHLGLGIYSLLAGAAAGWLCGTFICVWACGNIGAWPRTGEWGAVSGSQFRELFGYGADIFLIAMGGQLITASQTILVSRQLGPGATALWVVMTKVFALVCQIVWRIVGNAMPALAEMHVRQERERLWNRYRSLFTSVSVLAGCCAVLLAAGNSAFVSVWMGGKFSWPRINDVLLAIWLILLSQQCCHNSLVACLKEVRSLKYVFIAEGLVFIAVTFMILDTAGMTGMLLCSIVATALFTWSNGLWRVARLAGNSWKRLLWDWQQPLLWMLITMVPCWLLGEWAMSAAPDWARLGVNGMLLSVVGLWAGLRHALPAALIIELTAKLPVLLQRPVLLLTRHVGQQKQRPA